MYIKSLLRPAAAAAVGTIDSRGLSIFARGTLSSSQQGAFILSACRRPRSSYLEAAPPLSAVESAQLPTSCSNPFNSRTQRPSLRLPWTVQSFRASGFSAIRTMATDGASSSSGVKDLKTPQDVIDFWFGDQERVASDKEYASKVGARWFGFDLTDQDFIDTQMASKDLMAKAASGELTGEDWEGPHGCLARLLVLDQFPRVVYRGTAQAFASDEIAASLSLDIISKDWDKLGVNFSFSQRMFVYMPLMHSERMEAQDKCVEKCKLMMDEQTAAGGEPNAFTHQFAIQHRGVVSRFGRFPHRNAPLGRESTAEEKAWLASDEVPGWAKSQAAPSPESAP